jgi:hypothetical protein
MSKTSDMSTTLTFVIFVSQRIIRERGGRFLKRTKNPGLGPSGHFCWEDVGEQRAYEKACQALRENAPEIRRRLTSQDQLAAMVSEDATEETGKARAQVSDESRKRDIGQQRRQEPDTTSDESGRRKRFKSAK